MTENKNKVEFYKRKAIMSPLSRFSYIAKENDFIEVTEWKNGEGYDIAINERPSISLHMDELRAIQTLVNELESPLTELTNENN